MTGQTYSTTYLAAGAFLVLLMLLLFSLVLALSGCAGQQTRVAALPNRQTAELSADDVVRVMRRAGFTDDQVLELGTDLRNKLASTGAAQIQLGKKVEAMFAVDGRSLHVTTLLRGSFIYDLDTGRIR